MEHGPIEQGTGGAAISIHEGVVVGKPEMEDDRPDGRMEKVGRRFCVGEVAHGLKPALQFGGRGRLVEDGAEIVADDPYFFRPAQASGGGGIVESVVGDQLVDTEDHGGGQGLLFQLGDPLHGQVVIENHALAGVARGTAGADHFLGDFPSGDGTLQLAGGDRLLDERADEVVIAGLWIGDGFGDAQGTAGADVNLVEFLLHQIGDGEQKGIALFVREGKGFRGAHSLKLHGGPPFLRGEARRRGQVPELAPVDVVVWGERFPGQPHYGGQAVGGDRILKELCEGGRRFRDLHMSICY